MSVSQPASLLERVQHSSGPACQSDTPKTMVAQVYSAYFKQFMELVEATFDKHGNKKAIILGHSLGGMVALEFVRNAPIAWRSK